jgi:uncharacterized protein YdeI (YjbR/CyaY-like superfamily)
MHNSCRHHAAIALFLPSNRDAVGIRNPQIDAYISRQRDFARPILEYLRDVIHEGCPGVEEGLKWSSPSFSYHGILAGFTGFKEHVGFGFWKHELLVGKREGMGFGRVTRIEDLPPRRKLLALVKRAAKLNESGTKVTRTARKARKAIPLPAELEAALARNKKARVAYDAFSPSHKREYHEWISDAKAVATRERRVSQAVEWMAEGKPRNWKYM